MNDTSKNIDNAIDRLFKDFERIPNKYLTEDDVRIHLCLFLLEYYGTEEKTEDGNLSIPLHSEVRWYGAKKRRNRTDIVIFDVAGLSVTKSVINDCFLLKQIPKKGYASSTPLAAIELKFRRNCGNSDDYFKKSVYEDMDKLRDIKSMMSNDYGSNLVCRVVALDKKKKIETWDVQNHEIRLCYRFSHSTVDAQSGV